MDTTRHCCCCHKQQQFHARFGASFSEHRSLNNGALSTASILELRAGPKTTGDDE
jgi:hypothetical protein